MDIDRKLNAPKEGEGLHSWLLAQSRQLLVLGWPVEKVVSELFSAAEASGRTTQDLHAEIYNAVEGAKAFLDENPGWVEKIGSSNGSGTRWVDPYTWVGLGDPFVRHDSRRYRSVGLDSSLRGEAIRWGHGRKIIGYEVDKFKYYYLFGGIDFAICACIEMDKPKFRRLNSWNPDNTDNFSRMQYIVPNYIYDIEEESRDDHNIGRRIWMVIEFDSGSVEEQLALLAYIEKRCKIVLCMAVYSGGKSVHGWFAIPRLTEYRITSIHILAKRLGADKTTHSAGQYVRMPGGWNYKTKTRQSIIWYDYEAMLILKTVLEEDYL